MAIIYGCSSSLHNVLFQTHDPEKHWRWWSRPLGIWSWHPSSFLFSTSFLESLHWCLTLQHVHLLKIAFVQIYLCSCRKVKNENINENYEPEQKLNASIAAGIQLVLINQGLEKNQDLYSLLNSWNKITSWNGLLALKILYFSALTTLGCKRGCNITVWLPSYFLFPAEFQFFLVVSWSLKFQFFHSW